LTARDVERCVEDLETAARQAVPEIVALFVKPQQAAQWEKRRAVIEENERLK
jgi:hypothetical protein